MLCFQGVSLEFISVEHMDWSVVEEVMIYHGRPFLVVGPLPVIFGLGKGEFLCIEPPLPFFLI